LRIGEEAAERMIELRGLAAEMLKVDERDRQLMEPKLAAKSRVVAFSARRRNLSSGPGQWPRRSAGSKRRSPQSLPTRYGASRRYSPRAHPNIPRRYFIS
jgi:hypothetical protein